MMMMMNSERGVFVDWAFQNPPVRFLIKLIFFFFLDENALLPAEVRENSRTELERGTILQGVHNEMICERI